MPSAVGTRAPQRAATVPGMPASSRRRALLLICAVAVAVSTNYTIQGPALGFIRAEFALSSAEAGEIATAFFLGSALTMLGGGVLADRIGTRPAVTLGFLLVAIGNLGAGLLAPSFIALLGWRLLGGLGGGFGFVAGAAYTRSIFDGRGRDLAQGLYGASFLLGSALTLAYVPFLAGPSGDWRLAFTLSAIAVFGVWVAWTLLAPSEPRGPVTTGARAGLAAAVRGRNTWLLALCHMCGFGMAIVVGTWVTLYLVDPSRCRSGRPASSARSRLSPASSGAPSVASCSRAACVRSASSAPGSPSPSSAS